MIWLEALGAVAVAVEGDGAFLGVHIGDGEPFGAELDLVAGLEAGGEFGAGEGAAGGTFGDGAEVGALAEGLGLLAEGGVAALIAEGDAGIDGGEDGLAKAGAVHVEGLLGVRVVLVELSGVAEGGGGFVDGHAFVGVHDVQIDPLEEVQRGGYIAVLGGFLGLLELATGQGAAGVLRLDLLLELAIPVPFASGAALADLADALHAALERGDEIATFRGDEGVRLGLGAAGAEEIRETDRAEDLDGVGLLRGVDDGAVVVGELLLDLLLAGSGFVDEAGAEGGDAVAGGIAILLGRAFAKEGIAVELILEGGEVLGGGELGGEGVAATEGDTCRGRGRGGDWETGRLGDGSDVGGEGGLAFGEGGEGGLGGCRDFIDRSDVIDGFFVGRLGLGLGEGGEAVFLALVVFGAKAEVQVSGDGRDEVGDGVEGVLADDDVAALHVGNGVDRIDGEEVALRADAEAEALEGLLGGIASELP